jgi:drug/metabolite transporter (DMT)-like permease
LLQTISLYCVSVINFLFIIFAVSSACYNVMFRKLFSTDLHLGFHPLFVSLHQANTQDRILTRQKCELTEAILFSNFFSAVLSHMWTIASGEWRLAVQYCDSAPLTYQLMVVRALVLYLGVVMLLAQIKLFGAVMANVITTVRKVLTVLLSFFMFSHPLTARHAFGLLLFAAALALNDLAKHLRCGPCAAAPAAPAAPAVSSSAGIGAAGGDSDKSVVVSMAAEKNPDHEV